MEHSSFSFSSVTLPIQARDLGFKVSSTPIPPESTVEPTFDTPPTPFAIEREAGMTAAVFRLSIAVAKRHGIKRIVAVTTSVHSPLVTVAGALPNGCAMRFASCSSPALHAEAQVAPGRVLMRALGSLAAQGGAA